MGSAIRANTEINLEGHKGQERERKELYVASTTIANTIQEATWRERNGEQMMGNHWAKRQKHYMP